MVEGAAGGVKRIFGGESMTNNPASGVFGRKAFDFKNAEFQSVRNAQETINGIKYSGYALDQMKNRGVLPSIVNNTIEDGEKFSTRVGTIGYVDNVNNVRVILNENAKVVVTVIRGTA